MSAVKTKNPYAKSRDVNHPYKVFRAHDWEWRKLKGYQIPEKEKTNPYARWLMAVKSPYTFGSYDMGDTYISDVPGYAETIECICTDMVVNPECPTLRLIDKW